MKRLLLTMMIGIAALAASAQIVIPRTEIRYNVNYRWGVIDVMIARGTVTIQSDGAGFYGTLDGTSIPWEGRIICVSDTLQAAVSNAGGVLRESVQYQNGWYRRPTVSSFRSATYNPDDPAYFKNIAGQGSYDASDDSMEAITVTSDMIALYYYAHALDFPSMQPGEQVQVHIDGPYSKLVNITYNGQGVYNANGMTYPTYDITFEYSYGGRMSGFPVECKIGASDRIPVFLCANLPVGRVEMLYDPL